MTRRLFNSKLPGLSESARRQIEAAEQTIGRIDAALAGVPSGRRQQQAPGRMNKTEAAYARHLEVLQAAGEVVWFRFEALKFRLATRTYYTPDFAVIAADGELEFHEVKGHWEEDARVKIKVAAEMYPFRFLAVQKRRQRDGGGWRVETFRGGD